MSFTLGKMVRDNAGTRPDAVAISAGIESVTWGELDTRSTRAGAALQGTGVKPGDRVGILMKNAPVFYEVLFGCSKVDATAVALNWRLKGREILSIAADAMPRVVIVDAEHASLLEGIVEIDPSVTVLQLGSAYESWLTECDGDLVPVPGEPQQNVLILYSSGTTGKAKGITLTNENFSFIQNMARDLFRMQSDSVYLLGSPLFHIGGVGTGTALMTLGGRTVLLRDADPATVLDTIEKERVTHTFFVPAVIQRLVELQKEQQRDLSSLELLAYGAAPMSESLLRKAIDVLGCGFLGCYGMTETAGTVTALFPEEHESEGSGAARLQSVGSPLPWVELRIADPDTGNEVGTDEFGEIWIRSQANTPGYFNNPDASAQALVEGGWLRSGDGASRDAGGYIYLKDRIKDMIISGGENIYPMEVENVLSEYADVSEVAVIGVPHGTWGETVTAVVVPTSGSNPEPADIIDYARSQLAHYKCPTSVELIDEMPRTATGKVLKTRLREIYS